MSKPPKLSPAQAKEERARCRKDFVYFCETYVQIEDADTRQLTLFKLWNAQRNVARMLQRGEWIAALKARRLGFTALLAAYAVWLVTFHKRRTVAIINQDKEYAADFLDRCRLIHDHLPKFMRLKATRDNVVRLEFDHKGWGGLIRSLAGTKRAGRSLTANLVIFDEAAYIKFLGMLLKAAKPALETGGGQCVLLSTSDGPSGTYHDECQRAILKKSRFKFVFFDWRARPGRDQKWYDKEQADNAHDPLYMKREYPATPEEAWEAATGRIYPLFSVHGDAAKKFVRKIAVEPVWKHYRAIDWGGVDPFVCLWGCVVPGEGAGLSIDPSCENVIRELLAYSWDDNGKPKDVDNHACDALRYMVITPKDGIRGHLHIYRELYIPHSAALGLSLPDLAKRIRDMSAAQNYALTTADRSRPDSILVVTQMGIPTVPARVLRGSRGGEIEQGIARVSALIAGTAKGAASCLPPPPKSATSAAALNFDASRFYKRPPVFA